MVSGIDVRRSIAAGVRTGELSFEFGAEDGLIDVPYVTFSSPVRAALLYEIFSDEKVEVRGTVSFSLKGLCSRCLRETERTVEYEAEGLFVPNDPQDVEYGYRNGRIDLTEFLRDSVMFALPARLLCAECEKEE